VDLTVLPQPAATPASARGRITALLADDEPHVRAYLRLVLHSLGVMTVWEAGDGAEALHLFEQHRPTVVLLDLNMPVLNGEGVIHGLAERFPEAAVIVVTSQSEHQTVKRFAEIGAIGYVLKQQPREVVAHMIAEAIDSLDLDAVG
jgi:DNA-binding NarL/FixJ family response regulator